MSRNFNYWSIFDFFMFILYYLSADHQISTIKFSMLFVFLVLVYQFLLLIEMWFYHLILCCCFFFIITEILASKIVEITRIHFIHAFCTMCTRFSWCIREYISFVRSFVQFISSVLYWCFFHIQFFILLENLLSYTTEC